MPTTVNKNDAEQLMPAAPSLIYIAGRAHSGSTILDILLSNSPEVVSVGQLIPGLRAGLDHLCSCGKSARECQFWHSIVTRLLAKDYSIEDILGLGYYQANIARQPLTWFAGKNTRLVRRLRGLTLSILEEVSDLSGSPLVLDSTKEPTRALFIARQMPGSRIIHLVRDPREVLYSHIWRLKKAGYFQMRNRKYYVPKLVPIFVFLVAGGWLIGNLLCEAVRLVASDRVLRVRYEDLCSDPFLELNRIGRFIGIDMSDVGRKAMLAEALSIGHQIGGNSIRMNRSVVFASKNPSNEKLPIWMRVVTATICWPLILSYGYPLTGRTPQETTQGYGL